MLHELALHARCCPPPSWWWWLLQHRCHRLPLRWPPLRQFVVGNVVAL
jgi:hypothetical protein